MGFWEELAQSEGRAAPPPKPVEPCSQDAPAQCAFCPSFGPDVLLGCCQDCADFEVSVR